MVALICKNCGSQNYITSRNKVNMETKGKGKLELKKYCKKCKKQEVHKEKAKLK